jgi:N-acetylmuramoyl-L-alanine amidase
MPIRIHVLLLLAFFLLLPGGAAHALDVKEIRFGQHPDKFRTVVELSEAAEYQVFVLPADNGMPDRIVIDLPPFQWQAPPIKKIRNNPVLGVQSGEVTPGTMRIVIELAEPAVIKDSFVLPAKGATPARLVIDTVKATRDEVRRNAPRAASAPDLPADDFSQILANQAGARGEDNADPTPVTTSMNIPAIPPRKPAQIPAPPAAKTPLRKPLIVIDAGHGGVDPGAIGAGNLLEKNITLSAAKELKSALESSGRYRVILTRDDDRFLKLHHRVAIAREKEADLFISLHADSIGKPDVRGASIYTLSDKASDAQTAKLAARENQADLIAGVDLSHEDKEVANILIDLAMRDTMNQSKFFANTVVEHMGSSDIRILPRPHRYAGFAVLKAPDTPSVLVEMGFMSNNAEAHLLSTKDYQRRIARALTQSIDLYFSKVRKSS